VNTCVSSTTTLSSVQMNRMWTMKGLTDMGILGWIGEMLTGGASGGGGYNDDGEWHDVPAINTAPGDSGRWDKADKDYDRAHNDRHGK
jgi:phage-related minor tail protein